MVLVLRNISIFCLKDGSAVASVRAEERLLHSPEGLKDWEPSHDVWIWRRLHVVDNGEVGSTLPSSNVQTPLTCKYIQDYNNFGWCHCRFGSVINAIRRCIGR
jgi:hypothetical protein